MCWWNSYASSLEWKSKGLMDDETHGDEGDELACATDCKGLVK